MSNYTPATNIICYIIIVLFLTISPGIFLFNLDVSPGWSQPLGPQIEKTEVAAVEVRRRIIGMVERRPWIKGWYQRDRLKIIGSAFPSAAQIATSTSRRGRGAVPVSASCVTKRNPADFKTGSSGVPTRCADSPITKWIALERTASVRNKNKNYDRDWKARSSPVAYLNIYAYIYIYGNTV